MRHKTHATPTTTPATTTPATTMLL